MNNREIDNNSLLLKQSVYFCDTLKNWRTFVPAEECT